MGDQFESAVADAVKAFADEAAQPGVVDRLRFEAQLPTESRRGTSSPDRRRWVAPLAAAALTAAIATTGAVLAAGSSGSNSHEILPTAPTTSAEPTSSPTLSTEKITHLAELVVGHTYKSLPDIQEASANQERTGLLLGITAKNLGQMSTKELAAEYSEAVGVPVEVQVVGELHTADLRPE